MRRLRLHIPPVVNLFITVTALFIEGCGFALFLSWWAYDTPKGADIRQGVPFADAGIALFTALFAGYQVYLYRHPSTDEDDEQEDEPRYMVRTEEDEIVLSPTPTGVCPGCGHPIAEHPRGLGLACDDWYTDEGDGDPDMQPVTLPDIVLLATDYSVHVHLADDGRMLSLDTEEDALWQLHGEYAVLRQEGLDAAYSDLVRYGHTLARAADRRIPTNEGSAT